MYFVTAGTLKKEHLFKTPDRLSLLQDALFALAAKYEWQLEAWAVFSNHYHFVARTNNQDDGLKRFLSHLHADTARAFNRMDNAVGRTGVVQFLGY